MRYLKGTIYAWFMVPMILSVVLLVMQILIMVDIL